MSAVRVLLYGFGPYLQFRDNVTEAIVHGLEGTRISGLDLHRRVLPVRFDPAPFLEAIEEVQPSIVIGAGQHPRARKIRIERRAFNELEGPGQPPGPIV